MAKTKLELAVETGKWDAGLKKAQQALNTFVDASGGLGKALDTDSKYMGTFVQMMGKTESTAKTAKGQMNDYRSTLEQLTMQYNKMSEAQKKTIGQDYLQAIDQIKKKYQDLSTQVADFNKSLNVAKMPTQSADAVSPFGNLTAKFTKANIYAMLAEKGVDALQRLGDYIMDVTQKSQQLYVESEGVRIAFERLNRPDLLDKLREATHGTVNDLELMKQAVKFNDFKLSLDDMGTLLAFAQQKAKDTGQSVDYMVDSIVTGLGRQSLMILDNLGLSAAEIKEKMKGSGDMTKAVAEIIREQMSEAGEYIETASDRIARGIAENENAMMKLGETMHNALGVGGWDELSTKIEGGFIKLLTIAVEDLGLVKNGVESVLSSCDGFKEVAGTLWEVVKKTAEWTTGLGLLHKAIRLIFQEKMIDENHILGAAIGTIAPGKGGTQSIINTVEGGKGGKSTKTEPFIADSIAAQEKYIDELTKKWKNAGDNVRELYATQIEYARQRLEELKGTALPEGSLAALNRQMSELQKKQQEVTSHDGWVKLQHEIGLVKYRVRDITEGLPQGVSLSDPVNKRRGELQTGTLDFTEVNKKIAGISDGGRDIEKSWQSAAKAIGTVGSALSSIKQPAIQIAAVVGQAIATVALAYAETLAKDAGSKSNIFAFIAAAAAATISMATTIASIHDATGYAGGGIVKGTTYSGDQVPAMLNANEVVLNQAQVGNLASALQNNNNGWSFTTELRSDVLRIMLKRGNEKRGYSGRALVL